MNQIPRTEQSAVGFFISSQVWPWRAYLVGNKQFQRPTAPESLEEVILSDWRDGDSFCPLDRKPVRGLFGCGVVIAAIVSLSRDLPKKTGLHKWLPVHSHSLAASGSKGKESARRMDRKLSPDLSFHWRISSVESLKDVGQTDEMPVAPSSRRFVAAHGIIFMGEAYPIIFLPCCSGLQTAIQDCKCAA
jgi:hypothetical protein